MVNISNGEMDSRENLVLLDDLQNRLRHKHLPVLFTYFVLLALGIGGNLLTYIYFWTKTSKRPAVKLIAYLALVDCGVCVVAFPIFILSMYFQVSLREIVSCKIVSFLAHWVISASTGTLWVIAIDRHRKVCFPHGFQMSQVFANRLVLGLLVFTFLESARELSFYGIEEFPINYPGMSQNVTVPVCAYAITEREQLAFKVFNIVDIILLTTILVTLVVTYTHIVIVLLRMKRRHSSFHIHESKTIVARTLSETPVLNRIQKDEVTETHSSTSNADEKGGTLKASSRDRTMKQKKRFAAEKKMSFMMLVVSLAFLLCFAPYFGLRLSDSWKGHRMMFSELQMFIYRFPYLNSVLNPFIYAAVNPPFRQFVFRAFRKCSLSERNDRNHSM